MRTEKDVYKDLQQITSYSEHEIAIRGYLRVVAELLLDIREQSKKQTADIVETLRHQRLQ